VQDMPLDIRGVSDIPDDFVPRPLGLRADIIGRIREVAPTTDFSDPSWGTLEGPDFSVEFNLGGDEEVTSLALHVRGGDAAAGLVADLLDRCEWRAFDASSESGLFEPASASTGLSKWREYRDRVLRSRNAG